MDRVFEVVQKAQLTSPVPAPESWTEASNSDSFVDSKPVIQAPSMSYRSIAVVTLIDYSTLVECFVQG